MTTTAEKIKFALDQLRAKSKNDTEYADSILEFFNLGQEHRFSIFAFVFKNMDLPGYIEENMQTDIKPPDPEPLECWVVTGLDDKNIVGASISEPEVAGRMRKIKVREVTPQMEEDAKDAQKWRVLFTRDYEKDQEDAARLRYLITMDGVAWQPPGEGWLNLVKGNAFREEIDKAMEK